MHVVESLPGKKGKVDYKLTSTVMLSAVKKDMFKLEGNLTRQDNQVRPRLSLPPSLTPSLTHSHTLRSPARPRPSLAVVRSGRSTDAESLRNETKRGKKSGKSFECEGVFVCGEPRFGRCPEV